LLTCAICVELVLLTNDNSAMLVFPNAKINIGLNITEKRGDGYHNIESVFYPIGLCDALEAVHDSGAETRPAIAFGSSGIPIPGNASENLCVKAYHLISRDYPLPAVKAHLHKVIPIGAGLGGGSSDAAFFVKLLNDQLELGLAWGELHHYAKQLGSDCSFFITNKPVLAEGRGEAYERIAIDLSGYSLVLVHPGIHVSTAEAYAGAKPKKPGYSLEETVLNRPVEEWKNIVHNDFEDSIFVKYPAIKEIKEKLYMLGASYASMSGSGSGVYGIFREKKELKSEFPGCFLWEGSL
jgi:4-diphosphocytidyl-2-C-methyl-D-erythritol kinase